MMFGSSAQAQISVTRAVLGSLGQEASVASGITYMYNAGEAMVETASGSTVELTQGFEQPPYARDTSLTPIDTNGVDLVATNAFSPDGDGVNDTWIVEQLTVWNNNKVVIMNRWGDKIWEADNYDNTTVAWDGTNSSGSPVTAGTYFYVITIANRARSYSGWVQITK